jgi:hypothetical protein
LLRALSPSCDKRDPPDALRNIIVRTDQACLNTSKELIRMVRNDYVVARQDNLRPLGKRAKRRQAASFDESRW